MVDMPFEIRSFAGDFGNIEGKHSINGSFYKIVGFWACSAHFEKITLDISKIKYEFNTSINVIISLFEWCLPADRLELGSRYKFYYLSGQFHNRFLKNLNSIDK